LSALKQLVLMRIRTFVREPEALFWTFGFPLVMTLGLGLAFREDGTPPPVPIGVEIGSVGEGFVGALEASSRVTAVPLSRVEADRALRVGEIPLLLAGDDTLVFRYDPARAESREARLLADAAIQSAAGAARPVYVLEDAAPLPGARYIDWLIPGLIGLNLMSTGMWGLGFGLVTMRQKKQLKRLVATPMRKSEFLLAQILARLAFLLLEVPPIILFAWLAFDVVVAGSMVLLGGVIVLGALAFAGLGLLAASRARTIEGVSGINNLIMLPMFVLSGIFFSAARFPDAMQPFIQALPLTALNDAIRLVYNEGQGLMGILPEVAILLAWTGVSFAVALRAFRWQ